MVFLNTSGTPEGDERVRRLNLKARAIDDQAKAHIRDFYQSLPTEKKLQVRNYVVVRKDIERGIEFGALRQRLGAWIAHHPAHSDVMQAGCKSLPTLQQLLDLVNELEPLD